MLNAKQEEVLNMLIKIDKGLPEGVTLTFAVDNLADTLERTAKKALQEAIFALIEEGCLAKHTKKETENGIPFWLELTDQGRRYLKGKAV